MKIKCIHCGNDMAHSVTYAESKAFSTNTDDITVNVFPCLTCEDTNFEREMLNKADRELDRRADRD